MITLLRGLHSIAAQRGDGLHPELLRRIAPTPELGRLIRSVDSSCNAKQCEEDGQRNDLIADSANATPPIRSAE